jgi:hypothetical protein
MARTTTATKDMLRYQRGNLRGLNIEPRPRKGLSAYVNSPAYLGDLEDATLRTYRISAEAAYGMKRRAVPVSPSDLIRMLNEIEHRRPKPVPADVLRKKHVMPTPEKPLTKKQRERLDEAENRRWHKASLELRKRNERARP